MRRWNRQLAFTLALLLGLSGAAHAELQQSTSYSMNESELGAGGDFNGASTNYSFGPNIDDGGATLGETGVGNSASTNYQTNAGFNPTAQPGLTLCVGVTGSSCADFTGSSVDLGNLSLVAASTATAKFGVKNYTSWGYAVTILATAPTNSGHPLNPMGTQSLNSTGCAVSCTPATPGTAEQFGINLAANTTPSVGAAPVQNPSGSFSYGAASAGYSTANQFRFFNGDTIATSGQSTGETDYTMSFLANITPTTPGGAYAGTMTIIATGTY